jgi:hypothetical protein
VDHVGERRTVVGQHLLRPVLEVHQHDLAVRRRRGEHDRRAAAGHRQARDDPARSGDRRPVTGAVRGPRPQVRAAAVAQAEPHASVVLDRQPAGIGGGAGHDVAVERSGEVGDVAAVERHPDEPGVADRVAGVADHQE